MSDDDKPEKPDPIEDVRKGLGLLFRAAKSAIDQLPTRNVEEAVVAGAREVGRAIENVTATLDKQLFKRDAAKPPSEGSPANPPSPPPPVKDAQDGAASAPDDLPKGPRVS